MYIRWSNNKTRVLVDLTRKCDVVCARKQQEMNVEVRGVTMIVTGLFEIDAVGPNVYWKLFNENPAAQFLPALRLLELGQQRSQIKKPERFASQMCVRTEIR